MQATIQVNYPGAFYGGNVAPNNISYSDKVMMKIQVKDFDPNITANFVGVTSDKTVNTVTFNFTGADTLRIKNVSKEFNFQTFFNAGSNV